jgi:hypothetical protein
MRKMKTNTKRTCSVLLTLIGLASLVLPASAQSIVTSWFMQKSGLYVRVTEDAGRTQVTTWPTGAFINYLLATGLPTAYFNNWWGEQTIPVYSDVQEVSYDNTYVYVRTAGLPSHGIGPWYNDMGKILGLWPTNQHVVHRLPLSPPATPATKTATSMGAVGLWVNGVPLCNMLDGRYYDNGLEADGMATGASIADKMWTRNAVLGEKVVFDPAKGHQPGEDEPNPGEYHYHQNPIALRAQLNDNVHYDSATGTYQENTSNLHHSPILGWANDGYPVYGPYGYNNRLDTSSGIRRMRSGYTLRNGSNGTVSLYSIGRASLPQWAAELHGISTVLPVDERGPDVSTDYPLGWYSEDHAYLGDLGYVQGAWTMGVFYDLDKYNGRLCKTPEFPNGTYAYFVTIDDNGNPIYPYVIGRQFYGNPNNARHYTDSTTRATVGTIYARGGSESPTALLPFMIITPGLSKTIFWSSIEGASYKVWGSSNGVTWLPLAWGVRSDGLQTSYRMTSGTAAYNYLFYRVTRTALDTFDTVFQ